MNTSQIELPEGRRMRRRHPADFKQGVIQACGQPGVSIAAIALANGLNANMVRKWVSEAQVRQDEPQARRQRPAGSSPAARAADNELAAGFVALPVAPAQSVAPICIEITRGSTAIKVSWPGARVGD